MPISAREPPPLRIARRKAGMVRGGSGMIGLMKSQDNIA